MLSENFCCTEHQYITSSESPQHGKKYLAARPPSKKLFHCIPNKKAQLIK